MKGSIKAEETLVLYRDRQDHRDHIFQRNRRRRLPGAVDLRGFVLRVENQGHSEACGGFTAATIVEILLNRLRPARAKPLSPLFTWWNARDLAGDGQQNRGVSMRSLVKALEKRGICPEELWPFEENRFFVPPPDQVLKAGRRIRIKGYERIPIYEGNETALCVQAALELGCPVFLGLQLRPGLEKVRGPLESHAAQFAEYRKNPRIEKGGHFMAIVGYQSGGALVVNSWGVECGDQGFYLIPWDLLLDDAFDIWVITGLKTWLDQATVLLKRTLRIPRPTADRVRRPKPSP